MSFEQIKAILRAQWLVFAVVSTCIFFGAVIATMLMPKKYTSEVVIALDIKAADPVTGNMVPGYTALGFMATQADIINSQNTALEVVRKLELDKSIEAKANFEQATAGVGNLNEWLASRLLAGLEISPVSNSNVIKMRYTGTDPQFAAKVADGFAMGYMDVISNIRTAAARKNNLFFSEQLLVLRKELEKVQNEFSGYQKNQNYLVNDERIDSETQQLLALNNEAISAKIGAIDLNARAGGGVTAPEVLNSSVVQQLKVQNAIASAKLKEISERDGVNHPRYIAAKLELAEIQQQLKNAEQQFSQSMSTGYRSASEKQKDLNLALKAQKEKLLMLKDQKAHSSILQRNIDNAQRAYDMALQRYTQTALESVANQTNVVVLQNATIPTSPSSPRLLLNSAFGLIMAVLTGLMFVLLVEFKNRRIRIEQDAVDALGVPVLAKLN